MLEGKTPEKGSDVTPNKVRLHPYLQQTIRPLNTINRILND